MNGIIEKIMEAIWYNPKKALAVGLASGVLFCKIFRKGIFGIILALLAGKLYIDAEREQGEIISEEI